MNPKLSYRLYLNDGWMFSPVYSEEMRHLPMTGKEGTAVRLPHTVAETPYHYFDESIYQMVSCYQRMIPAEPTWAGKSLRLTFEAAGHSAEVYLNGVLLKEHHCGYTAFTVDLTGKLTEEENLLTVRLDSRESLNIPPFGHVIDYMTYGGLYREAYLDIQSPCHIRDVFPKVHLTEDGVRLDCEIYVSPACKNQDCHTRQSLHRLDGSLVAQLPEDKRSYLLHNVALWSPDAPNLYILRTELAIGETVTDVREDRIGFRDIDFRADGLYVNGQRTELRGLDRHQSYPYVGYAMPESMQKWDADLIKNELGLNAVRTSHYPQSHHFLDRCDELGILVFTEIPGWQHIGDEAWKAQAVENTREMVQQYRNHPSIFLWGVRINESQDDDALYARTGEAAHSLDPTRPTSGVRYLKNSSLLEDIYAFNDFTHDGIQPGCQPKSQVTPDMDKGYLISEYGGHLFPTKPFDDEAHRQAHMLRHAAVMDAYYAQPDIAGGFGWCMFDYNTHQDFGSGDRICYHGVMDMFRNRKLCGLLYAAQQDEVPVLEISSAMEIGEHPAGVLGPVYAVTNADAVRMYKNDRFIAEFPATSTPYPHMPHGPTLIDDFVGDCILEDGQLSPEAAADVKTILNAACKYGIQTLPDDILALQQQLQETCGVTLESLTGLYFQYIGSWGGDVIRYRFEAVKDGRVVAVVTKQPMKELHLAANASHYALCEGHSYDVASVRITARSDSGNLLPYYQEPVTLTVSGDIALIGPSVISLKGGMGGTYVKTLGRAGQGTLTISAPGVAAITMEFTVAAPGKPLPQPEDETE